MSFLQDLREKLIAIRFRPKKSRTVNPILPGNSISAGGETGSNVPTTVSTLLRMVNDGAQVFLPGVAAVVAPVPITGPPLAAAITGLVAILQSIDRNKQNISDLAALRSRLHRLSNHLCNAPTTSDPGEQMWRESLTSMLQETSDKLMRLDKRYIRYTPRVAQAITGCSNSINEYLLEYSVSSQMRVEHEVRTTSARVESMQGLITRTFGVVTLVDATGYQHSILVEHCNSFQQFDAMLGVLFKRDSIQAKIQEMFLATGDYHLSIDHGEEVTQLTSENWIGPLAAGTKVVMGVVVKQRRLPLESARSHRCHFCRTRNDLRVVDKQKIFSMHCKGCKRRFQVSFTEPEVRRKQDTRSERTAIKHKKVSHGHVSERNMQLIQNFHLKHEEAEEWAWQEKELALLALTWAAKLQAEQQAEGSCVLKCLPKSYSAMSLSQSLEALKTKLAQQATQSTAQWETDHKEMMSRFETLDCEDDESGDDDSSSHAESWNSQANE